MKLSEVKALLQGVNIFTAPLYPGKDMLENKHSVFLAGSIEMDKADNWQTKFIDAIDGNILVLNPRRDAWDSSWEQSIDNPQFVEQVTWELDMLDAATTIVMYFDPATKSPISLLELGLFARTGKMLICCPEGFWRKGNVYVVCKRFNVPVFETFSELIEGFKARVEGVK